MEGEMTEKREDDGPTDVHFSRSEEEGDFPFEIELKGQQYRGR
jgi:hypothetical protein